jgi:membrane associated rhomboid family serine protease
MPDLPARRRAPPGWTRPITERLTPVIKGLVLATAFVYAVYVFYRGARPFLEGHVAIGTRFFHGELWQPFTSLFVHVDPLMFFLDLLGIWFTGAQLEHVQGTRRFLTMFFAAGVLSNLALAGVARLMVPNLDMPGAYSYGMSFAVLALFVAFSRIFDRTQAQILGGLVVQARYIGIVFVAWFAISSLVQRRWEGVAATAVAAIVGFFGAAPGGLAAISSRLKARRGRRRYRVLEGGRPSKKYLN